MLWLLLIPATPEDITAGRHQARLHSHPGTLPLPTPRQYPGSDLSESQGQVERQVGPQLFPACDWDGPLALAEQSFHTTVMVGATQGAH